MRKKTNFGSNFFDESNFQSFVGALQGLVDDASRLPY
jgi:hypothetical protein